MGIENIEGLEIIQAPTEFILSHGELARIPVVRAVRLVNMNVNLACFGLDFESGRLEPYQGTFVAYHKGRLCGQSSDENKLAQVARAYYGSSNLDIIEVPARAESTVSSYSK